MYGAAGRDDDPATPPGPGLAAGPADGEQPSELTFMEAAARIGRFSALGVLGAVCYSGGTAIISGKLGRTLGSDAQVVYRLAYGLSVLAFIGPVIGVCNATQVRTSRAISRDPTGQRAALVLLRAYTIAVPLAIGLCLAMAAVVGPLLVGFVWEDPAVVDASAKQYRHGGGSSGDGGFDVAWRPAGSKAFEAEVKGMSPAEQVGRALWFLLPANVLASVAWSTEFATLYRPEIQAVANFAGLVATYAASELLTPHGLWAAALVQCASFGALWLVTVAMASWQMPQFGAVLASLGQWRRKSLASPLEPRHYRNFASFSFKCILYQIGVVSGTQLALVVVGPRLEHSDFAAMTIVTAVMFMMWAVDEGINEGMATVMSMEAGHRCAHASTRSPRIVLTVGAVVAIALSVASVTLFGVFRADVAAYFTEEPPVADAFLRVAPQIVLIRLMASVKEVWMVAMKTIERADLCAMSTLFATVGLVAASWWAVELFGPFLSSVMWAWAAIEAAQLVFAAVVTVGIDWGAALRAAVAAVPSDSGGSGSGGSSSSASEIDDAECREAAHAAMGPTERSQLVL